jgi:hypothetical protein
MEFSGPVQACNGIALPFALLFKKKPFTLGQGWRMSQRARAQLTYFLCKYFVT